jgi:thioredoxin reductase
MMTYHDYIIIGAGPAGLQMGYFLQKANRDYLILEANDTAGSFFAKQPRHRTLLSINKRFNFYEEADFNMRHDWNSLLTDDYSHLFTDYSEELYPHADDLYRYLMDFADKSQLNIQYNTRISLIDQTQNGSTLFHLTDTNGNEYACARLFMATGTMKPNIPQDIEGVELAETYEDHNIDPKYYENKRVLIIGRGNSAFEVANHLAGHAAYIHIAIGNRPVDLAWQTHFVGHVRAINNTILDMFYLKSLHSVLGFNVERIRRLEHGVFQVDIWEEVPHWQTPGIFRLTHNYEHVILCTGSKYVAPQMFAPEITPAVDEERKYPVLTSSWESSIPNLLFIGTTMAARDRKSASSFIHGFRYNIRTLFHLLEERYEGIPYPSQSLAVKTSDDLLALGQHILERVSRTDALYQLYEFLCDVLVFSEGKVEHFKELPVDYVLERPEFTQDKDIILMTLEFGFHNYPANSNVLNFITYSDEHTDRSCAALLHPVFRRYVNGELVEENRLGESLVVRYGVFRGLKRDRLNETQDVYQNIIVNMLNRVVNITEEIFTEQIVLPEAFTPATEENPLPNIYNLPQCTPSMQREKVAGH